MFEINYITIKAWNLHHYSTVNERNPKKVENRKLDKIKQGETIEIELY